MKGLFAALLALSAGTLAQAQMRIQYAEPVAIAATPGNVSFDAYGRRFELALTDNARVTANLPAPRKAELARYRILRGTLNGQPGSWVRLTAYSGRVEGAIWDGHDLYAVTSLERIAQNLTTPIAATPTQTVVYRLSDTLDAFPQQFCAAAPTSAKLAPNNGLVQYRALVAELSERAAQSATIPLQIEISLIGDAAFQDKFGADATVELLARHNVADGVFAEQVGLLIIPSDLRLAPTAPDPFTSNEATTLLDQVSAFRRNDSTVSALGLAHLMTGRKLDGNTTGIAFIGGVCDVDQGASLTEVSLGATIDGLVMAHELGHNFGAVHDGTGVCADAPPGLLMSPVFSFSSTFSQCSLDTMRPVIAAAQCIKPADYGDVELPPAAAALTIENDVPLVLPYVVRSSGTQTARNAELSVTVPPEFTLTAVSGANCAIAGDTATCHLGDIPAGEERSASVTLLPAMVGNFNIDAQVSADNNPSTHNDRQQQPVQVAINADARLTMSASATTLLMGDTVDISIVVASIRSHAVRNAVMTFSNGLLDVSTATVPGGTCTVDSQQSTCTLPDIAAGSSRKITIHATAAGVGLTQLAANVNPPIDADATNNFAHLDLHLNPVRDVGLDAITENTTSLFGQPFEFDANLHSYGAQPISNVTLNLTIFTPASADDGIESVAIGGVVCRPAQKGSYQCAVGTMAAGELQAVVIRGHGATLGTYEFRFRVAGSGDQDSSDNELVRGITIKHAVDVGILTPSPVAGTELQEISALLSVQSNGSAAVPGAVLDITAPASVRFTRSFVQTTAGSCTLISDQHLQCALAFGANGGSGLTTINYVLIGEAAGSYKLTAKLTTPNDEAADNDSISIPVTINPVVDVGVQELSGPAFLMVGSEATISATVFTGTRPVPAANAIIQTRTGAEIRSLTSSAGTCVRQNPERFECDLGNLPGSAAVSLSIVLAGVSTSQSAGLDINAYASSDNNGSDNIKTLLFQTAEPADLGVSVASTAAATAGTSFALPSITLRHSGTFIEGRLEITLPAGVTLESMSAGALMCSGTSTLQCNLGDWPENQGYQVDLNLQAAAAGAYTVGVKVSAINDTDASNNESSVAVTVSPAAPPPPVTPPSGGGGSSGGGGGRMEWLGLAFLALLAARRPRLRFA